MTEERSVDTDRQADQAWILGVQRKLYQWSKANPDDSWRDMWGWLTDLRMLRHSWRRVASNRGRRSAGVDGMTVGRIRAKIGERRFLDELQAELRSSAYRPSPSRRKLIPKAGKPIALSAIEERYERWTHHRTKIQTRRTSDEAKAAGAARHTDRAAGRCVFFPVRYADDFVVMVSGRQDHATAEKSALAEHLRRTTGLELSPEKTSVTAVTDGFEFLGFHVTMRWNKRYGYGPRVEVPKAQAAALRRMVKQLTRSNTTFASLSTKLKEINPILRGWASYYRHCPYAGRVFAGLDWYISDRLWRWMRKKFPKARVRDILGAHQPSRRRPTRRFWREGVVEQYLLNWTRVERFRLAWMRTPDFAMSSGEPDA